MTVEHAPLLVGAGQITQRDVEPAAALDPIGLMVAAARRAAADAGGGDRLLAAVDTVAVVNVFCRGYANAPRLLAERLGAHPAREITTTVGGNSPQLLVSHVCDAIAAGRVEVALVAGAEAIATVGRARRARVSLDWPAGGDGIPEVIGDDRPGTSDHEIAQGFQLPVQIYPLFENALRARDGLDPATHRARLGELMSRFSAVAAAHPDAWFREPRTAAEIATVTPANRMIAFPYPKLMNAILDVDQGAAVLLVSTAAARRLGLDASRFVHPWGGAEAHDHWFVSERVGFTRSPAIRAAGAAALAMAGVTIGAVAHLDLYSCFPAAVQIGRDALGIAPTDARPLTVTGGLPYFGGPGNDYTLHAVATMMDRLRAAPGSVGLVTALGWYLTKHAVGVYASAPPARPWGRRDRDAPQRVVDAEPAPALATEPQGEATVETYTVLHDRDGAPIRGLVVGRLGDARRFLAHTPDDRDVLEALEATEGVGRRGRVRPSEQGNRFEPV